MVQLKNEWSKENWVYLQALPRWNLYMIIFYRLDVLRREAFSEWFDSLMRYKLSFFSICLTIMQSPDKCSRIPIRSCILICVIHVQKNQRDLITDYLGISSTTLLLYKMIIAYEGNLYDFHKKLQFKRKWTSSTTFNTNSEVFLTLELPNPTSNIGYPIHLGLFNASHLWRPNRSPPDGVWTNSNSSFCKQDLIKVRLNALISHFSACTPTPSPVTVINIINLAVFLTHWFPTPTQG